jgi:hypothetical protein
MVIGLLDRRLCLVERGTQHMMRRTRSRSLNGDRFRRCA